MRVSPSRTFRREAVDALEVAADGLGVAKDTGRIRTVPRAVPV
jgi:hypothetical protein